MNGLQQLAKLENLGKKFPCPVQIDNYPNESVRDNDNHLFNLRLLLGNIHEHSYYMGVVLSTHIGWRLTENSNCINFEIWTSSTLAIDYKRELLVCVNNSFLKLRNRFISNQINVYFRHSDKPIVTNRITKSIK